MARVYISIGSNVNREENIRSCLQHLRQQFGQVDCSAVYENKSVGFEGDNFYNLVAAFDTDIDVHELTPIFREIESRHGRVRDGQKKFSSRTLDVDLLMQTARNALCRDGTQPGYVGYRLPRNRADPGVPDFHGQHCGGPAEVQQ